MKTKILALGLLLLSIPLMILWKNQGKTMSVGLLSYEHTLLIEPDNYQMFYLKFEQHDLTTKNIIEQLKDQNITKVSPVINPIYKDKITSFYYHFKTGTIESNLTSFIEYYAQKLENNGFKSDALKARMTGLTIETVGVYASNQQIYDFLVKHPLVSYSINDQTYQTLQEGKI